jgi:anthranilate phosphoribosyltransferase
MIIEALQKLLENVSLTEGEMARVMDEVMSGKTNTAQIASLLTALRIKGETVDELTGAARIMRSKVNPITVSAPSDTFLLDTCGTGGDGLSTFNISTVSAFVIAGSGVKVAKHGNRSVTSKCGSADLMEALGVNIEIPVKKIEESINTVNIGFLYAPLFHSAMKHVAPVRKELGFRTIFNILGPLTNPAHAPAQLLGVFADHLTDVCAQVLKNLGSRHALVVHGRDKLDEITITGETKISELANNEIKTYSLNPANLGMEPGKLSDLTGKNIEHNKHITLEVLDGKKGIQRDVVLLNSAAGLIAAEKASDFKEGIEQASESIDSGNARAKLEQLIQFTNA